MFLRRMTLWRTTVGSREDAEAMARRLVESRAAACCHVWPISSTYEWDDKIAAEGEFLVEARGRGWSNRLGKAMLDGHPYKVPLVERVGPVFVNGAYAGWAKGRMD